MVTTEMMDELLEHATIGGFDSLNALMESRSTTWDEIRARFIEVHDFGTRQHPNTRGMAARANREGVVVQEMILNAFVLDMYDHMVSYMIEHDEFPCSGALASEIISRKDAIKTKNK
jgi:hypothetical protein